MDLGSAEADILYLLTGVGYLGLAVYYLIQTFRGLFNDYTKIDPVTPGILLFLVPVGMFALSNYIAIFFGMPSYRDRFTNLETMLGNFILLWLGFFGLMFVFILSWAILSLLKRYPKAYLIGISLILCLTPVLGAGAVTIF